ncbi:hypothetical protein BMS3Bbin02_01043 [bacterium BMS3Bbin02]|nr:hypothetical protein BMS3Bbin02_01043 [bacterium BMS3Bbin02]
MITQGKVTVVIRRSASDSRRGMITMEETTPIKAPATADSPPTTVPPATTTERTWRRLAPMAANSPSCRTRRWATTVSTATANSVTSTSTPATITASTTAAAMRSSVPVLSKNTLGTCSLKDRTCSSVALTKIRARSASKRPGTVKKNCSDRRSGFSTTPTSSYRAPESVIVSPRETPRRSI